MIGSMYGAVMADYPGSETWQGEFDGNWVEQPLYLLEFDVVELRKNPEFRPEGICFVTVVFKAAIALPALNLATNHLLYWGGDAPLDTGLSDMLPFSTGPYHGFREVGTDRLFGHGSFFATRQEVLADAKRGSGAKVEDLTSSR